MKSKIKFDYTWVNIILSFLMVFIALGFCSSARSLYISPICEALEISRSAFSVNDTCRFVATAVLNLFFGSLIARFGTKKLILAGFASLIISCILYSIATSVFLFYVGGVFLGIGFSWTTTTMVGAVVNKYCRRNRGTITGAILASNGVGAALAIQILTPIIYDETNPFGYRNAYKLVCLILLVVAILVLIFFKENCKPATDEASDAKKKGKSRVWDGIEYSKAVKTAYFYGALVCLFLTGMVLQGITGVAAPHLKDVGIDAAYIATVLSINSLALSGAKFLIGFLYDRFGLRLTTLVSYLSSMIVMILLCSITNSPAGKTFAMMYAVMAAVALPLETVMIPIFSNDLFGEKSSNKVLGIFASVNTAGYALGAPITNICYDLTGSYNTAFYIAGGIMMLVTIAMQFIINASNKHRT